MKSNHPPTAKSSRARGFLAQPAAAAFGAHWVLCAGVFLLVAGAARSADPELTLIDLFGTNQVTVHFNTEPNRTYTLQYADALPLRTNSVAAGSNAPPTGAWSNLFVTPALPFFEHYIVPDWRTNQGRFYRLIATP